AKGEQLDDSNAVRVQIWKDGLEMFLQRPILGVGAGDFQVGRSELVYHSVHRGWMSPHSLPVQVMAELGIVGILAFANFLVQLFRQNRAVFRSLKGDRGSFNLQLARGVGACLVCISAISFVSHTMYRPY